MMEKFKGICQRHDTESGSIVVLENDKFAVGRIWSTDDGNRIESNFDCDDYEDAVIESGLRKAAFLEQVLRYGSN